jgi:hypothetical protein
MNKNSSEKSYLMKLTFVGTSVLPKGPVWQLLSGLQKLKSKFGSKTDETNGSVNWQLN